MLPHMKGIGTGGMHASGAPCPARKLHRPHLPLFCQGRVQGGPQAIDPRVHHALQAVHLISIGKAIEKGGAKVLQPAARR